MVKGFYLFQYQLTLTLGAGPSGVSTAYHLSQQAFCAGIPTRISLYDNSSHIGGRAVHMVDIVSGESLDLGSTTFSKAASLLTNAADYLGLETITSDDGTGDLTGYGSASFGVLVSLS